jgi:hypothetical protein
MVLIVFSSLAVFYSPQWILWFAPFLLPLAAKHRRLIGPIVALDVVTYLTFPVVMDDYLSSDWNPIWLGFLVFLRFALLGVLLGMLAWKEFRPAFLVSFASQIAGWKRRAICALRRSDLK